MTEMTPTIEDRDEAPTTAGSPGDLATLRAAVAKRPGRPKGTNYRGVDAPLHDEMRRLLDDLGCA